VVVKCGHLYCWPCIYEWMDKKGNSCYCPVCKNPINSQKDFNPIFTKDENSNNTNRFREIPKRPKGERNPENYNNNNTNNNDGSGFNFFGGVGFFPFFGFNFGFNNNNPFNRNNNSNSNPNFNDPLNGLPSNMRQSIINFILLIFMFLFLSNLNLF